MPGPFSGCFVMTKSVRQHKIVKGGKVQKSESCLICVVTAEVTHSLRRKNRSPIFNAAKLVYVRAEQEAVSKSISRV